MTAIQNIDKMVAYDRLSVVTRNEKRLGKHNTTDQVNNGNKTSPNTRLALTIVNDRNEYVTVPIGGHEIIDKKCTVYGATDTPSEWVALDRLKRDGPTLQGGIMIYDNATKELHFENR